MQAITTELRDALRDAVSMTRGAVAELEDVTEEGYVLEQPRRHELAAIVAVLTGAIERMTAVCNTPHTEKGIS